MSDSKPLILTARDITSAFAYCITKGSPHAKVENLSDILEDIRAYLIKEDFKDENDYTDAYNVRLYTHIERDKLHALLARIRDNVPSFNKLNITKVELDNGITDPNDPKRSLKMGFVGRRISNPRDHDFIDLDACIRNAERLILNEDN